MFRIRSRISRLLAAGAVAGLAITFVSAGSAAAAPSNGSADSLVNVAQGSGQAPLNSGVPLGDTDPNTVVNVSFILRSPALSALEKKVESGWTGRYLSTAQFATAYGQSPSVIKAIENYLRAFGITTSVYSDRLDISAIGTAGQFNKALSISLQNFRVLTPDANNSGRSHWSIVHASRSNPRLPQGIGDPILAILGLSNYSPFTSNAIAAVGKQTAAPSTASSAVPAGELSPQDFVNRYQLAPLEAKGSTGQGETLGIVTLAALDPAAPFAFWNDVLGLNEPASRLTVVPIDGGAPGPSLAAGSDETALDVEQSGAIAPKANIRLYVAPNTDPGFADAFFAAASDNIADTVSTSWGESETYIRQQVALGLETPAYASVFDEVFAEFGAQGQSSFAASGDSGAYDALPDPGTTNLAVDNPADSPLITAGGGTTLPGSQTYGVVDASGNPTGATVTANIPAERAWSWDYLWPLYSAFGAPSEAAVATSPGFEGGDGGGFSSIEARPGYQQGVSAFNFRQYLSPTTVTSVAPGLSEPTAFSFTATPALQSGRQGTGRAVPDVSTNADPQTGYAVYDPALFGGNGFAQYGGTSFVAPQLNGATAVIDSAVGHRVGFWNPQIYGFAQNRGTPFTPLNDTKAFSGIAFLSQTSATGVKTSLPGEFSNNNLYYTGRSGAFWNPATGLGIPNLTALAGDFGRHH